MFRPNFSAIGKGYAVSIDSFILHVREGFDLHGIPPEIRNQIESVFSDTKGKRAAKSDEKHKYNVKTNEFQRHFRDKYKKHYGEKYASATLTAAEWGIVKATVRKLDEQGADYKAYLEYVFANLGEREGITIGRACKNERVDGFVSNGTNADVGEDVQPDVVVGASTVAEVVQTVTAIEPNAPEAEPDAVELLRKREKDLEKRINDALRSCPDDDDVLTEDFKYAVKEQVAGERLYKSGEIDIDEWERRVRVFVERLK